MVDFLDPSDRTLAQVCDRTQIRPGDRVRLTGNHSHAGQTGVYVGYASWQRMWGARVRLDDGTEVKVWRTEQWECANGATQKKEGT